MQHHFSVIQQVGIAWICQNSSNMQSPDRLVQQGYSVGEGVCPILYHYSAIQQVGRACIGYYSKNTVQERVSVMFSTTIPSYRKQAESGQASAVGILCGRGCLSRVIPLIHSKASRQSLDKLTSWVWKQFRLWCHCHDKPIFRHRAIGQDRIGWYNREDNISTGFYIIMQEPTRQHLVYIDIIHD